MQKLGLVLVALAMAAGVAWGNPIFLPSQSIPSQSIDIKEIVMPLSHLDGNSHRYLTPSGIHIGGENLELTCRCSRCGGSGITRNWWGGRVTCKNCKGTGERQYCERCGGDGKVWRWWGWKTDCPECVK